MATQKQIQAARENIKKAQKTWRNMSKSERARSPPEGSRRKAPGRGSDGDYYHVAVRNKSQFKTFRTHDVGDPGGIQRVAGQRKSGTWGTVKWLIPKEWAHMKGGKLIADSDDARKVLEQLGSAPVHSSADMFEAKPRPKVPEKDKPTKAQQQARQENIKKAQRAAHQRGH